MSESLISTIKKVIFVPPHPAGIPFIAGGAVAALGLFFLSEAAGIAALVFTVFCLYFFRDPQRVTPQKPSLVVSPADGQVSAIVSNSKLPPEIASEMDGPYTRISIFLSVLDVHVNRNPVGGKVLKKVYAPGKFFNADLDKASEDNERCTALIETAAGQKIGVVQIAGLIARRIISDLRQDQDVVAGARFGIIRFGSRLDVYIPEGISPLVCVGQRAIGGETVLADLEGDDAPRTGLLH